MAVNNLWYDRLCFPKKPNEKVIGAYLASKKETERLPKLGCQGDTFDRDVRSSCYLAHKKLINVKKRLVRKRRSALETRQLLDKQWAELEIYEDELRKMFIKFNKFIRENMEKRERASCTLNQQNQLHLTKVEEIENRSRDCIEMGFMHQKINEIVQMYWIYETFLQTVVNEHPAEFRHPKDILKRYEALIYTKNTLHDHQFYIMSKLDNAKTDYCRMIDSHCVRLAGLHTKLANLNQRYESAKLNSLKWEKLLLNIRSEAAEKVMDLTTIKASCTRIYGEICERKGIKPVYMNNYGKQLEVIKKALYDFECINNKARALEEEKKTLSEKPCVSGEMEWQ